MERHLYVSLCGQDGRLAGEQLIYCVSGVSLIKGAKAIRRHRAGNSQFETLS